MIDTMEMIKGRLIAPLVILAYEIGSQKDTDRILPRLLDQFIDGAIYHGILIC